MLTTQAQSQQKQSVFSRQKMEIPLLVLIYFLWECFLYMGEMHGRDERSTPLSLVGRIRQIMRAASSIMQRTPTLVAGTPGTP
jgi:hypothetical protein